MLGKVSQKVMAFTVHTQLPFNCWQCNISHLPPFPDEILFFEDLFVLDHAVSASGADCSHCDVLLRCLQIQDGMGQINSVTHGDALS